MDGLTVIYRDGSKERFEGGRQQPKIEHKTGCVVIVDQYGGRHTIPNELIQRVDEDAPPGRW